ncbi:protein of unknown function [Tenacibaculum sp. 190130A14a]|uniref:TIGR02757 family protein n=1 Tax=Tenacibaculum polynesiense TaxID=3137857 RepID=A0ABM9P8F7_9FLAO
MNSTELKEFLDEKVITYNSPDFIESDPIQIPHQFSLKEDIEIAGFLAATIAWGNRKMIINNAKKMMDLMGNSPFDFVLNHTEEDLIDFESFVHRTFNAEDFKYFVRSLQNIYKNHHGLESVLHTKKDNNYKIAIHNFKKVFFEIPHLNRTLKHVSDPLKGSASKRINMLTQVIYVARFY